MSGPGAEKVRAPFGLIKSGGVVIEQSNKTEDLHDAYKEARAMPVEFWRVEGTGFAKLVQRRVK